MVSIRNANNGNFATARFAVLEILAPSHSREQDERLDLIIIPTGLFPIRDLNERDPTRSSENTGRVMKGDSRDR